MNKPSFEKLSTKTDLGVSRKSIPGSVGDALSGSNVKSIVASVGGSGSEADTGSGNGSGSGSGTELKLKLGQKLNQAANLEPGVHATGEPAPVTSPDGGEEERPSLRRLYTLALSARFFIDTGTQIFMPFLPNIAAGLGVDIVTMGQLVSLRSATGLVAPAFGVMADRQGYRSVMRKGLLMAGFGFLLVGLSTALWMAVVGMALSGLGTFAFLPTIQAYVSARLPYHQRGRGLGILEYAWALSGIFGLFLVGQLIAATSWRTPFLILGGMLLLFWLLYLGLPASNRQTQVQQLSAARADQPSVGQRLKAFVDLGVDGSSAWADILAAGLIMFSAMHVMIAYGAWLQAEYGLGAAFLGTTALILGVADLGASGLVSLFSDRLGKRRTVICSCALALLGYLLMPVLNVGIIPAVAGLILARFAFEVAFVSNMALLSEQSPTQRGKVLTFGVTGSLIGSTLAGFSGPWSYQQFGVLGLSLFSAVSITLAFLVLIFFVREPQS